MAVPELRLERMRPVEVAAAMDRVPIAWIPLTPGVLTVGSGLGLAGVAYASPAGSVEFR